MKKLNKLFYHFCFIKENAHCSQYAATQKNNAEIKKIHNPVEWFPFLSINVYLFLCYITLYFKKTSSLQTLASEQRRKKMYKTHLLNTYSYQSVNCIRHGAYYCIYLFIAQSLLCSLRMCLCVST